MKLEELKDLMVEDLLEKERNMRKGFRGVRKDMSRVRSVIKTKKSLS